MKTTDCGRRPGYRVAVSSGMTAPSFELVASLRRDPCVGSVEVVTGGFDAANLNDLSSRYDYHFLNVEGLSDGELNEHFLIGGTHAARIAVCNTDDPDFLRRVVGCGVVGLIHYGDAYSASHAICDVCREGAAVSPRMVGTMMRSLKSKGVDQLELTGRERQIIELVVGLGTREAASLAGISVHTLRKHLSNIYKKMGVRNRMELAIRARQLGIV